MALVASNRKSVEVAQEKPVEYVFLCHGSETKHFLQCSAYRRKYARKQSIEPNAIEKAIVAPALWAMGKLSIWTPHAINPKISHSAFAENVWHPQIHGKVQPVPLMPMDYLHPSLQGRSREYIKELMEDFCEEYPELKVIGLGALNKNALFSNNGLDFVETADRLGKTLTTGNSMTSAVIVANVLRTVPRGSKIFVNGSTSNIGIAIITYLALRGFDVTFHTKSIDRAADLLRRVDAEFEKVMETEDQHNYDYVIPTHTTEIEDLAAFKYVILGSSAEVHQHVREDAWCTAFAVPPPPQFPQHEEDRIAGKNYPPVLRCAGVKCPHGMKLDSNILCPKGTSYACHVGTLVHAKNGWTHHEVGDIDASTLDLLWAKARELGFKLTKECLHGEWESTSTCESVDCEHARDLIVCDVASLPCPAGRSSFASCDCSNESGSCGVKLVPSRVTVSTTASARTSTASSSSGTSGLMQCNSRSSNEIFCEHHDV